MLPCLRAKSKQEVTHGFHSVIGSSGINVIVVDSVTAGGVITGVKKVTNVDTTVGVGPPTLNMVVIVLVMTVGLLPPAGGGLSSAIDTHCEYQGLLMLSVWLWLRMCKSLTSRRSLYSKPLSDKLLGLPMCGRHLCRFNSASSIMKKFS